MSITVGSAVPQRGNAFSRWLGRTVLTLLGWKLRGEIPNLSKVVMIGAPHTTNFDGVISIGTLIALGLDAHTMIKDSAFKGVLGRFLLWAGALPINRNSPKGVVEQSIDTITRSNKMWLLIAPEGTRSGPESFKRGFHLIAHGAGVPIFPVACNYKTKTLTFGVPLTTTADYAADLAQIIGFIAEHCEPRHPTRLSKPLCEAMGRTWTPPPSKAKSKP